MKKVTLFLIVIVFLYQNAAFCIPEIYSALRPPLASSDTVEEMDLLYGFATTPPQDHDPMGVTAYFTHTGSTDPDNYKKLLSLFGDLSLAREEIFCCFKTSSNAFPTTWTAAGFILDISRDDEVLYAGKIRRPMQHIFPLKLNSVELSALKRRLRGEGNIDTSPSDDVKEMDITNADITGICINTTLVTAQLKPWPEDKLRSFSVLMAMAVKYDLPIVLIHAKVKKMARHVEFRQQFEKFLEQNKADIARLLKKIALDVDENEFKKAILQQLRPEGVSNSVEEFRKRQKGQDSTL